MVKKILIVAAFSISITAQAQLFTEKIASDCAKLPLNCLQKEYPNKLGQTLANRDEIQEPKTLHPSFYGCFDWHSSVHGHWSLVYVLRRFPSLKNRGEIQAKLVENLSAENLRIEREYLLKPHEKSFERTYGWTWILKLQQELDLLNQTWAQDLAKNLRPLSELIVHHYSEYMPKLTYPLRNGTHTNSAFGFNFAWDYAIHTKNERLLTEFKSTIVRLYQNDRGYRFEWEPSGTDFFSPGLEEIGLMGKVLPKRDFLNWLSKFCPEILKSDWALKPASVSDRTDGYIVHLDGLNYSRAWNLYELARLHPKELGHLKALADQHLHSTLPHLHDGNYEGEHWLASFALLALDQQSRE